MSLLDHFHPPLLHEHHWEGFHHSWAAIIAHQLNEEQLPPSYYADPEITGSSVFRCETLDFR